MSTVSAAAPIARKPLYTSLFVQVLVALLLGIVLGMAVPDFAVSLKIFSDAFLKLISMIVAPIVFCVVVHGIAGAGDLKKVGRVGVKALIYFEVMTTIALIVGLLLAYLFGPGHGMNIDPSTLDAKALTTVSDNAHKLQGGGIGSFLLNIIPTTSFDALARNDVLQVLFFAILFGVSLALVGGEKGERINSLIDAVSTVLFRAMGLIVRLAPFGVLGAVAYTVGKYGVGSLKQLISLVALFYVSVTIFVLGVLGGVMALAGLNIFKFLGYLREELTIVLATASSDAVLPQIMRKLERLGVKDSVVGLVIPTGYSFNLDAFSIYLTLAVVFIAQATNTPLSLGDLLAGARRVAGHLQGRAWRSRLRHRDPRRHAERRAEHSRDRPRAGAVGRLVHRHGPRARQSDRQLRRHRRDRGVGRRPRPRQGAARARGRRTGGRDGGVIYPRHCERSEAIQSPGTDWIASSQVLLAMTNEHSARRLARPKILDQPQQHPRAGVGIGGLDMLVRMMADAAAAAHEHHGDIGDVDHRHAVMPCPARQLEDAKTFCRDGFGHLDLQPGRAGHGAVFMGDVDLQRKFAAFGDLFDLPDDIGHRHLAMRVGRRAHVDGERNPPRDHIGGAGHRVDIADGADQPALVGAAKFLDRNDAFGGARQRVAPQRHRHRAGVTGHAGHAHREAGGAGYRGHHADRQVLLLQHRSLLDVQFDISDATRGARAPPRRYDRDRGRNWSSASRIEIPARSLAPSTLSSNVPATARLPSSVEAKRMPSSSAKPVTSTANGSRFPRLLRSATQEIAVISPSGPSHLPASRTVS